MGTLRRPNWEKWKQIPDAEVWKVVALSVDIDPDQVSHSNRTLFVGRNLVQECQEFTDHLDIVIANLRHRDELKPIDESYIDPADAHIRIREFAHFARSIDWILPAEFPTAVYKPKWIRADAWNEAELRDMLCGLEPNVARSGFTEINDAAEAIRRAVLTGELAVLESPSSTAERPYGPGRFFTPSEATRWAMLKPGRFPKFPFSMSDFAPASKGITSGESLDPRSESAHLHLIGALLELLLDPSADGRPFPSQSAIINSIAETYPNVYGLSKRELETKFPAAKARLQTATTGETAKTGSKPSGHRRLPPQ